ncbi:MAG: DMT family transporter [Pseudomonadota bacterium]
MNLSIPIWLALAQMLWAGSYVAMKYALAEMPVAAVVFLRYGIVSVIFLTYWLFRRPPKFTLRDTLIMGGVGVLDFFLAQVLQVQALKFTQAVDASILVVFEPLLTILLAALVIRERPTRRTWIALPIGMVGMVLLSKGTMTLQAGINPLRLLGNLLFLLSLAGEATYSVAGKTYARRYGAIHSVAWMMIAGFLVGSIVNFPTISRISYSTLSVRAWLSVLFLAVACSVFSYTLWYWVLKRAQVQQAALSLLLQPFFGALFGFALLGETIGAGTVLGGGLIISSLVWWQVRS